MRLIILTLVLATLLFTGCFGEEQQVDEPVEQPPPPPPPVVKPTFTVTSPLNGEMVYVQGDSGDVTLTMSIQNLILKQPGGVAKNGEGHFKISVDSGESVVVASKLYVISDLGLGDHTVDVELVNNDGTSYSPRISTTASFTVESEAPLVYVPQTYTVKINDFDYDPAEIAVKKTDNIKFVNQGSFPRSATCFIDGKEVFDTDVIASGSSATVSMDRVMECEYYSTTHRAMTGKVIVESNE